MMLTIFPELTTERMLLRKIIPADQPVIFKGLSDPAVIRYYGVSYTSLEATADQMKFYDDLLKEGTGIWWAVCFKEQPAVMVGACGFNYLNRQHKKMEIGYWLLPAYFGKGIMTEAVPEIIRYAFAAMDIHRVEAVVEAGNDDSTKLLKKLNFTYEGTLVDSEIKNGKFISLQSWALLNRQ
jgi:[ribosomal protein S5]-alanine N-acetyltransferase